MVSLAAVGIYSCRVLVPRAKMRGSSAPTEVYVCCHTRVGVLLLLLSSSFSVPRVNHHIGMPGGQFSCDEHLAGPMPSHGTELCTIVETTYSYAVLHEVCVRVYVVDGRAALTLYVAFAVTLCRSWGTPSTLSAARPSRTTRFPQRLTS